MEKTFYPQKRTGALLQAGLILIFAGVGGYFFYRATLDQEGLDFLLHMMIALVFFAPLPLLFYRLYSLLTSVYVLRRDGLLIRWGLRREDIPLDAIEWIRPAADLGFRLPMPWLRWQGAILGSRRVPELGLVEFVASDAAHMLMVATPEKIYVISPDEPQAFLYFFQHIAELGSLMPLQAQSIYPKVLLGHVWEDSWARRLILVSFGIGLILLAVVGLSVPGLRSIEWLGGVERAPAERLLLLPVVNGMIWLFNLAAGIFFFRQGKDLKIAGYLIWGTSGLLGLMLLVGGLILMF
jgi:hypothetical protein